MQVTFKGFKGLTRQIADVSRTLSSIGCCEAIANFLCSRFRLDREYYKEWLCTKDVRDIAELVVLYLSDEARQAICKDLDELSALQ